MKRNVGTELSLKVRNDKTKEQGWVKLEEVVNCVCHMVLSVKDAEENILQSIKENKLKKQK